MKSILQLGNLPLKVFPAYTLDQEITRKALFHCVFLQSDVKLRSGQALDRSGWRAWGLDCPQNLLIRNNLLQTGARERFVGMFLFAAANTFDNKVGEEKIWFTIIFTCF